MNYSTSAFQCKRKKSKISQKNTAKRRLHLTFGTLTPPRRNPFALQQVLSRIQKRIVVRLWSHGVRFCVFVWQFSSELRGPRWMVAETAWKTGAAWTDLTTPFRKPSTEAPKRVAGTENSVVEIKDGIVVNFKISGLSKTKRDVSARCFTVTSTACRSHFGDSASTKSSFTCNMKYKSSAVSRELIKNRGIKPSWDRATHQSEDS